MTEESPVFVQFPHPGGEHIPPGDDMPWNIHPHRRKFLVSRGRYIDEDSRAGSAVLTLWGEWEPPSRVVRRWPKNGRLPRVLHRPYWVRPAKDVFRQNTDPWIWGERMLYSNCKQIVGPERRPTSMQKLHRGSVLCFGSSIDGEFCIDTRLRRRLPRTVGAGPRIPTQRERRLRCLHRSGGTQFPPTRRSRARHNSVEWRWRSPRLDSPSRRLIVGCASVRWSSVR